MKAAILVDKEKFEIKNLELPGIEEDEVLVKIISTGVCGSDMHVFLGESPFDYPVAIGHEIVGAIVELGKNIKDYKKEDTVVIFPAFFCGKCEFCLKGNYNLCSNLVAIGESNSNGGFAEYIKVDEGMLVKVPENFSLNQSAMVEPIAVGVHAVEKSCISKENKAVIFGAGTIGLSVLAALKFAGIKNVTVIDLIDDRLMFAKKLGADNTINFAKDKVPKNWPDRSFGSPELYSSGKIDVVFDTVNIEPTINKSVEILKKDGSLIVVGEPSGDIKLKMIPLKLLVIGEIKVIGSCMYLKDDFYKAIEIIKKYSEISNMVTKIFDSIDDTQKAFEEFRNNKNKNIKILVRS